MSKEFASPESENLAWNELTVGRWSKKSVQVLQVLESVLWDWTYVEETDWAEQ